jgi:hypothetical protein
MVTFHRSLIALALGALFLQAGPALAADDITRSNGSIATETGLEYGRLKTSNGGIRLADDVVAAAVSTINGGIRAGDGVTSDSLSTVNGGIRVGERARIAGAVRTVNGSILIGPGSHVGGDVETTNGAIGLVATEVGGDVAISNGDLTIGVDSHVRGGLHVRKASANWMPIRVTTRRQRVVVGPGAVVDGAVVIEREVQLYVHETARIGPVTGAEPVPYSTPTAPRDAD